MFLGKKNHVKKLFHWTSNYYMRKINDQEWKYMKVNVGYLTS